LIRLLIIPIEVAVAHANVNKPEKAIIEGIMRQPNGIFTEKLPTVVKKLMEKRSASTQWGTN
jgi:hypothetical protein